MSLSIFDDRRGTTSRIRLLIRGLGLSGCVSATAERTIAVFGPRCSAPCLLFPSWHFCGMLTYIRLVLTHILCRWVCKRSFRCCKYCWDSKQISHSETATCQLSVKSRQSQTGPAPLIVLVRASQHVNYSCGADCQTESADPRKEGRELLVYTGPGLSCLSSYAGVMC